MQSKLDFFIGLFGCLFVQASGILFLYLVFEQIPLLDGWSIKELAFIYGFSQIPKGIDHLFADYIWLLSSQMVTNGEFDRYLLRPIPPFFQLLCDRVQLDAVGELLVGGLLVYISVSNGTIRVTFIGSILFVMAILAGAVIYTSVKLFFAALAFWMTNSFPVLQLGYEISNFTKYPTSIYPKGIQFVSAFIVPFAFASFYPAEYFVRNESFITTIIAEVCVALIAWVIAFSVFKKGVSVYKSAGS
ncbi:MAG: ABC-2 family transporter protein [Lachnospiraceae bacterium]|nr:ABC-2 family transporter protein [Lachnospiraceae bacterium]